VTRGVSVPGAKAPRWQGRCNHCGAWSTLKSATPSRALEVVLFGRLDRTLDQCQELRDGTANVLR